MKYPRKPEIVSNFDTCVIFCVDQQSQLDSIFNKNYEFLKGNGIEVLLCLNGSVSKSDVLDRIKSKPFGNWKVLTDSNMATSLNKATAFNVAVNYSSKKYVLFIPDALIDFYEEFIYQLRYLIERYKDSFVTSSMAKRSAIESRPTPEYECLILNRVDFLKAGGFCNSSPEGITYERLVLKLQYLGFKKLNFIKRKSTTLDTSHCPLTLSTVFRQDPHKTETNGAHGNFVSIYDYSNNFTSEDIAKNFLTRFVRYKVCYPDLFKTRFNIVALVQTFNESANISPLLSNLGNNCDGVILLDDSSTDNTFDLAEHPKLLMKVQKKRTEFNDLENRNILLDIASLICSTWFVFVDADERFDSRFNTLRRIAHDFDSFDTIGFWFANLWDDRKFYRPLSSGTDDKQGLWRRLRMFKNIGHSQIDKSSSKLHFTCVPYVGKTVIADILVLHYGALDLTSRAAKYQFYKSQDENWEHNKKKNYQFLLEEENATLPIEGIQLPKPQVIRK